MYAGPAALGCVQVGDELDWLRTPLIAHHPPAMLTIPAAVSHTIQIHCQAAYPAEACGLLFGLRTDPVAGRLATRFVTVENQADKLHALDPVSYPRTSRDAFAMNESKVARIVREAEVAGEAWLGIVHSHIDCGAYFSSEDIRNAAPDGVPVYPELDQLVVDVRAWGIEEARSFRWNGQAFVPIQTFSDFKRPA